MSIQITSSPPSSLTWAQDVFGNAIASAYFDQPAESLIIDSHVTLELESAAWPVFAIDPRAASYPFFYSVDELADLGALLDRQYPDPTGRLSNWAAGFVLGRPADTLALLKDLNAGISNAASYVVREEEGVQSPAHTLDLGRGSCRDFAMLFVEAARALGFGARVVTGYLFNPNLGSQAGTTHAWAEVFVPGAGWITFDPTNRQLGGFNLIPVAVARDLSQVTPVSGSFAGGPNDFLRLIAGVHVSRMA